MFLLLNALFSVLITTQDYIQRTMKGEVNILQPKRPNMIALTSSTSGGQSKAIPIPDEFSNIFVLTVIDA